MGKSFKNWFYKPKNPPFTLVVSSLSECAKNDFETFIIDNYFEHQWKHEGDFLKDEDWTEFQMIGQLFASERDGYDLNDVKYSQIDCFNNYMFIKLNNISSSDLLCVKLVSSNGGEVPIAKIPKDETVNVVIGKGEISVYYQFENGLSHMVKFSYPEIKNNLYEKSMVLNGRVKLKNYNTDTFEERNKVYNPKKENN